MEQKRPADIFKELLDYLWDRLCLEEKGWKRLNKGDFKKKAKKGLIYQICFDRSRYNYIDYKIGHGNVEVGFTCIIKQKDDWLYSFKIESPTVGSFFRFSILPMLQMWITFGRQVARSRSWIRLWGTMSEQKNSMIHGMLRMRQAINSIFKSKIWKNGHIGHGI